MEDGTNSLHKDNSNHSNQSTSTDDDVLLHTADEMNITTDESKSDDGNNHYLSAYERMRWSIQNNIDYSTSYKSLTSPIPNEVNDNSSSSTTGKTKHTRTATPMPRKRSKTKRNKKNNIQNSPLSLSASLPNDTAPAPIPIQSNFNNKRIFHQYQPSLNSALDLKGYNVINALEELQSIWRAISGVKFVVPARSEKLLMDII